MTTARSLLVTGGGGGIGRALSLMAGEAGWHVHVGYNTGAERAGAVADAIKATGGTAGTVWLPLHAADSLRAAAIGLAEGDRPPTALALCAAPAPDVAAFGKQTPEQLRTQLEAQVVGNHLLLAEVWRRCFRVQGGGTVLAVLTAATGPRTASHMAGYVAAKAGFEGLLRAAAAELGRAGLRIGVVRPGYVETPMLGAFPALAIEQARAAAPGGRFLKPEEVAAPLAAALETPPELGAVAELPLPIPGTPDRETA